MAGRTPHSHPDALNREAQLAARATVRGKVLPESQGTDSVPRTWCSEGDAGRHYRPTAERTGTPSPSYVQPRLDRIAEQAQQYPDMAFTTLAHHLDVAMLERAFWGLNPRSAPGVDRVTWRDYKRNLEINLEVLHEKLVNGTYVP